MVPVILPPLRDRRDDIVPLAHHFLGVHGAFNEVPVKKLSPEAEVYLKNQPWPGNVRELENVMERATILIESIVIQSKDLESISIFKNSVQPDLPENQGIVPLKKMEETMIYQALENHNGNRTHAAKVLGISVRTLRNKLHEYEKTMEQKAAGV